MKKATLLVVEDEPNLLMGFRDILEMDDYNVITAPNGRHALELLESFGDAVPDLILSDIMMPYMDGFEFLQTVRQNESWVSIPFIFITAKGEKADVQKGRVLGVDDYLVKPFDADELLVAVDAKLRRHRAIGEAQASAISNVKRSILTILNHEFRTPLTLVVAYADMLREHNNIEGMSEEELLIFLREINNGADRLRRLVENFILLVELETGDAIKNFEWRKQPVKDLGSLIKAAKEQVWMKPNIQHELHVSLPQYIPPVMADRDYLTVIIREILDNAVKFSEPANPIQIEVESVGSDIYMRILDYGRGIKPDKLREIWNMFYQINREHFEDQGAGSGLAIIRGLAEIHGGRVEVESEYGKWTRFTLILPQSLN